MNPEKEIGNRYGRLTIKTIVLPKESKYRETRCLCDCSCGNTNVEKRLSEVINGYIMSCGCLREKTIKSAPVKLALLDKANERRRFHSLTSPGEYKKYLVY